MPYLIHPRIPFHFSFFFLHFYKYNISDRNKGCRMNKSVRLFKIYIFLINILWLEINCFDMKYFKSTFFYYSHIDSEKNVLATLNIYEVFFREILLMLIIIYYICSNKKRVMIFRFEITSVRMIKNTCIRYRRKKYFQLNIDWFYF